MNPPDDPFSRTALTTLPQHFDLTVGRGTPVPAIWASSPNTSYLSSPSRSPSHTRWSPLRRCASRHRAVRHRLSRVTVEIVGVASALAQLVLRGVHLVRSSGFDGDVAAGAVGDATGVLHALRVRPDPLTRDIRSRLEERLGRPGSAEFEHEFQAAADDVADLVRRLSADDNAVLEACRHPERFRAYLMRHGGDRKRQSVADVAESFFDDVITAAAAYFVQLAPRSDRLLSAGLREVLEGQYELRTLLQDVGVNASGAVPRNLQRERLERMRRAGEERVAASLRALGLAGQEVRALVDGIFATSPTVCPEAEAVVITGMIGVGKSTELERIHRQAIDVALASADAPIPVFVHVPDVGRPGLQSAVQERARSLGDPARRGVHLVLDSLDEVGIEVDDLRGWISTMLAEWPGSTVVLGTRTAGSRGFKHIAIAPWSADASRDLMAALHAPIANVLYIRPELADLLSRPLFAIGYALNGRRGRHEGIETEAQLVDGMCREAVKSVGDDDAAFDLLTRLGEQIVEGGGAAVDPGTLEAAPPQMQRLLNSRIVHTTSGRISFQLAVLTEWFAAQALLTRPDALERSTSSPVSARRWRYALVLAVMQGSANQVDNIMTTLLHEVPGTAAWVLAKLKPPRVAARSQPIAETALEAGERVRRAADGLMRAWPQLHRDWLVDSEPPAIGVRLRGGRLTTAWHTRRHLAPTSVILLDPSFDSFTYRGDTWTGMHSGVPAEGAAWPWHWALTEVQSRLEYELNSAELIAESPSCWQELAWQYASRIVGRSDRVTAGPVKRAALEDVVVRARQRTPIGDVTHGGVRGGWRLSEAEALIDDLQRLGQEELSSPWPSADSVGDWTWLWWTTGQLKARLTAVTRAALNAYQELVERHLPLIATELPTYQLFPARLAGTLTTADPDDGPLGRPQIVWHLEPLPAACSNESCWQVVDREAEVPDLEMRIDNLIHSLRGDVAECLTPTWHGGMSEIYDLAPAAALSVRLLMADLEKFGWLTRRGPLEFAAVRPRLPSS